ncbi:MAG: cation diffusion facilitator family transporter [Promethearchaeota archaeon]
MIQKKKSKLISNLKSRIESKVSSLSPEEKVTWLSIFLVVLVFAIKLVVSFFTKSLSFLVELSDSILDLIAVSITFIALKESQKEPDFEHLYGHHKINSFAAFLQGLLILGMYGSLLYSAISNWIKDTQIVPEKTLLGMTALLLVIVFVFFISRKIIKVGKQTKNQLIIAQGVNFQGDFYRNITVIVSLLVSFFGIPYVDSIIAIIFSLKSLYEGFKVISQSYKELIDTNPISKAQIDKLQEKLLNLPAIQNIQDVKIRTAGNQLDLSMCVQVSTEQTAIGVDNMSSRMRAIIDNEFPEYECNTIFCTSSPDKILAAEDSKLILESIRNLITHFPTISNIHNISIDQFQNEFLIQLHVDVVGSMTLQAGHKVISQYEEKIIKRCHLIIDPTMKIEIVSHIEPNHEKERVHDHTILTEAPEELQNSISQIILEIPHIQKIRRLRVLSEADGLYLSGTLAIDGAFSISKVHSITEMVEHALFASFENLENCTLHCEPL